MGMLARRTPPGPDAHFRLLGSGCVLRGSVKAFAPIGGDPLEQGGEVIGEQHLRQTAAADRDRPRGVTAQARIASATSCGS